MLAVDVAVIVVLVGVEPVVLAPEVEPLLEHHLGPEHLHRKSINTKHQETAAEHGLGVIHGASFST